MRLNDKVILVTGSTTGIGEAIARRAWREGAKLVIHGRDAERGRAIVAELGDRVAFVTGDLADPETPKRLIQSTLDTFGRLDALVNNAAWVVRSDVASTDPVLFDRVMAINVR